jgi:hypothetical protein
MANGRSANAQLRRNTGITRRSSDRTKEKPMDPVLQDIYSTIIPSAPFIIAAYALLWAALLIYVIISVRSLKKSEAQLAVLEETVASLKAQRAAAPAAEGAVSAQQAAAEKAAEAAAPKIAE